jgi:hypothetical protein
VRAAPGRDTCLVSCCAFLAVIKGILMINVEDGRRRTTEDEG